MNQIVVNRARRTFLVLLMIVMAMVLVFAPLQAEPNTRYVDGAAGADTGVCTDPAAPCKTIDYAAAQAGTDDEVLITGGMYVENVKMKNGILRTIRGGYSNDAGVWTAGGETPTIIDGNDADSTIEIRDHSDVIIEDVTVTGGMGQDDNTFGNGCGGFKIQNSNVEIRRVVIKDNSAGTGDGGALCAAGDDGPLTLLVEDSVISGNRAPGRAGAFSLFNTKTTVVNSLFTDNVSSSNIANVMLLWQDDDVTLLNSTVVDNNPAGDQAIHVLSGTVAVVNSIMVNNALNLQADPPCPTCFDVSYSDVQGWSGGTGNIDEDPLFVDAAGGDYRLQGGSPAIDAGTPSGAPASDLDGNLRDALPDMGAYEYIAPPMSYVFLPVLFAK